MEFWTLLWEGVPVLEVCHPKQDSSIPQLVVDLIRLIHFVEPFGFRTLTLSQVRLSLH